MDDEKILPTNLSEDLNFATLLRIGHEALESCEEKIQSWKAHQTEYLNLKENLEKLPQQISHDVMVPFGNCAFMSGKMIHTNEILVLLGDNWFVSRSAFQAIEIVIRRLEYVEKELKKLEEEKEFHVKKLKLVENVEQIVEDEEEVVEIREPYLESDDEHIAAKRIKVEEELVPTSNNNEEKIIVKEESNVSPGVSAEDYAKLVARLDELEMLEELEDKEVLNDSLESENDAIGESETVPSETMQVLEEQKPATSIIVTNDEDERASDIAEIVSRMVNDVAKSFDDISSAEKSPADEDLPSERKLLKKVTWDDNSLETSVDACDTPTNEAAPVQLTSSDDSSDYHLLPPAKSILKNRRESSPIDYNMVREMEDKRAINVLPGSLEAFTGVVCEKPMKHTHTPDVNKMQPATQEPPKRRASKFKVQRASIQ